MKDLSYLLRTARERSGLSQTEAARRAGVDQTQISRWELGKNAPSIETLHKLAVMYEIPPAELGDALLGCEGA